MPNRTSDAMTKRELHRADVLVFNSFCFRLINCHLRHSSLGTWRSSRRLLSDSDKLQPKHLSFGSLLIINNEKPFIILIAKLWAWINHRSREGSWKVTIFNVNVKWAEGESGAYILIVNTRRPVTTETIPSVFFYLYCDRQSNIMWAGADYIIKIHFHSPIVSCCATRSKVNEMFCVEWTWTR